MVTESKTENKHIRIPCFPNASRTPKAVLRMVKMCEMTSKYCQRTPGISIIFVTGMHVFSTKNGKLSALWSDAQAPKRATAS